MLDKFFDFIFDLPVIKIFKPLWVKKKDIVLYIFFGGLTTLIAMVSFAIPLYGFNANEFIANFISWVLAVLFAFITNRIWVFTEHEKGIKAFFLQLFSFCGGRLFSFGLEMLFIFIFITNLQYNEMLVKIFASIFVLVANYFISKLIVFKSRIEDKK